MPRRILMTGLAFSYIGAVYWLLGGVVRAEDGPEVPRIDSVAMSVPQPQASDDAVIWYDDFDGPENLCRIFLTDRPERLNDIS